MANITFITDDRYNKQAINAALASLQNQLNSVKALRGKTGAQGKQGIQGLEGPQGIKGEAGAAGIDATSPIGAIFAFAGKVIPDGYLKCDGSSFDKALYPELESVLGSTNTPNLTDRFIEGTATESKVGTTIEAGLPNLTGEFAVANCDDGYNRTNGIFSENGRWGSFAWTGSSSGRIIRADASKKNKDPIYGKSTTVQPKSYVCYYIIKAK